MTTNYLHIEKISPKHEPTIVGTRLTISRIIRDLQCEDQGAIDFIINTWEGRITKEMIDEAVIYYKENKEEIDFYIQESKKRAGLIIKYK